MPDREFAKGDRVRWVVGNLPMAVAEVYPPFFRYRYRCVWTEKDGTRRNELFQSSDLTPDDAPPTT